VVPPINSAIRVRLRPSSRLALIKISTIKLGMTKNKLVATVSTSSIKPPL
jgi:hypothetical protein